MTDDIAPYSEVTNYPFAKDSYPMVGEKKYDPERKCDVFPSFHILHPSGRTVCDCLINPWRHEVKTIDWLEPQYRWTLCKESMAYLQGKIDALK